MALPYHPPRYVGGPSTSRPMRVNDALWRDLTTIARTRGINTTLLVRAVLEQFADDHIKEESTDHTVPDTHGEGHA
jgi:predicted DNA-binding ribbon-helix-helix protein